MDFLMNELSIRGQFNSVGEFFVAVERLMGIRQEIIRLGSELFCHRNMAAAQVTPQYSMPQAIQSMDRERQRAWMQWLTRFGPFWVDGRQHGGDDWLELANGDVVTDSAIGEAAYCRLNGLDREIVSIDPSSWLVDLISVTWRIGDQAEKTVAVKNHWALESVSQSLANAPLPFYSWPTLDTRSRQAFARLTFSDNTFVPLHGHPYSSGVAERIWIRLATLNRYCECFDGDGNRTSEGDRIYANHFVGDKAWFTDSSDQEKIDFKNKLTFPHPEMPGERLFCSGHGKVKSPQIRIHFPWPIVGNTPVYIVYVGPKITIY